MYFLTGLTLTGSLLKNYALGTEFGDPYSVTSLLRWVADSLVDIALLVETGV